MFLLLSCDSDKNIMVVNDSDINLDLSKRYVKYNDKIFSGKVVKLYSNTNDTFSISIYKNGLKDNIWKKFYRNGNIQELREFLNKKDKTNFELEAVSLRNSRIAQPVIVELNINYPKS